MDNDLFVAVFEGEVPVDVEDRAQRMVSSQVHRLAPNILLISSPSVDSNAIVRGLIPEYDLTEDPTVCVVFKLNGSYSGYFRKSLWNWLDTAQAIAERS